MKFVCENCKAKYQIGDEKVAGKTLRMKCRRCGHMIQVSSSVTESSVSRGNPASPAGELTGAELLLTGVHTAVTPPAGASASAPELEPKDSAQHSFGRSAPDDDSATVVRPSPLFLRNTGAGPAVGGSVSAPRAPSAPRIVPPARASVRPGALGGALGMQSTAQAPAAPRPGGPGARPASVAPPASTSSLSGGFSRAVSTPPPASSPDSSQTEDWYVGVGGVPLGPVRLSVIKEKAAAGSVDGESLVWREGFDEWQPLKLFPVLLALVDEARKRPATPTPAKPMSATVPLTTSPAAGMIANSVPASHSNGAQNGTAPTPPVESPSNPAVAATAAAGDAPLAVADPFRPSVAPVGVMSDPFAAPQAAAAKTSNGASAGLIPMSDSGGLSPSVMPLRPQAYAGSDSIPPRPTKKGIHPMAWAFIAMCAAFGGVAAWALFFRKSETQVVYQNASATPTAGTPGVARPGGPGPDNNGSGTANPGDPSTPTTDASGNPQVVPGNPNYRPPGTSPSTAKSAKPGSSGTGDDPDLSGFDTGQTPGPKATSDATSSGGKGNLSAGEIEGVVNRNKPTISRRCWDPAYEASDGKTKSAKVTASVTIGPSGSVTSVSTSGGGGFPTLASCVQGSIAGWHFPPADGESHTVIPFSFSKQ
ncbi:MAG: GYF domain-containing protein [Polyangiaceae bacterium]